MRFVEIRDLFYRYTTPSPSRQTRGEDSAASPSAAKSGATPLRPLSRRQQSNVTEDGELSGVFGSVLSSEKWVCIDCDRKFRQVCTS